MSRFQNPQDGPIPAEPTPPTVLQLPSVQLTTKATLMSPASLQVLTTKSIVVTAPGATEPYGQQYGFTLFATNVPASGTAAVNVQNPRDRAIVFLNGRPPWMRSPLCASIFSMPMLRLRGPDLQRPCLAPPTVFPRRRSMSAAHPQVWMVGSPRRRFVCDRLPSPLPPPGPLILDGNTLPRRPPEHPRGEHGPHQLRSCHDRPQGMAARPRAAGGEPLCVAQPICCMQ